jgi:hypothetical protein
MFYAAPVEVGASSLSVKGRSATVGAYNKAAQPGDGAPSVTIAKLVEGIIAPSSDGVDPIDCARLSSIVIPAGLHAIVDFMDGRRFNVYSADKPTKVKPSLLAPAHMWRVRDDTTAICKVWIEDNGSATETGIQDRQYAQVIFNLAIRTY